jgi:hypothetical protein
MRISIHAVVACAVAAAAGCAQPPQAIEVPVPPVASAGCDDARYIDAISREALPSAGPLVLAEVACIALPSTHFPRSPPALSPDGTKFFAYDGIAGLWVGTVGSKSPPRHVFGRLTFDKLGYADTLPFAWSADSASLLGARQSTGPGGWAHGPLLPVVIPEGGQPQELPPVTHRAGPLDGLLWVGSGGLAVAEFGTKGGYYRPEHADSEPTIALIDARQGTVLQAIGFPGAESPLARIQEIDARLDREGRVRAVFTFDNHWFEWRQGEELRSLWLDVATWRRPFALSPDLETLLVVHGLSATGMICERNPNCPPPTPSTGTIADLRELGTGRVVWRIEGTAQTFSGASKPVISADGRYALITMPQKVERRSRTLALVSMADGRVLQELYSPWQSQSAYGFGEGGRSVWISGGTSVLRYRWQD